MLVRVKVRGEELCRGSGWLGALMAGSGWWVWRGKEVGILCAWAVATGPQNERQDSSGAHVHFAVAVRGLL
jgi:hypothetical protein